MSSKMTIDEEGNEFWFNEKGYLHREDGPAIECRNGYKAYYKNDLRHRIEGASVEYIDGRKEWWVGGEYITDLIWELLSKSPFGKDVHLGILAGYFAARDDFRLLDIVQPYLTEQK